ncbi:MAG: transcription elongation factor GreA [Lachnospiraceae bacterium]|nr:transcription elongation factor GreA [Lachnospiraceae bacterium]MBR6270632.1 transcription elongation factor GreA [Lachnospiraceae bacterium]
MSEKKIVLTASGQQKLIEELEELKYVKKAENVQAIKEARGQGDLSENAEYDAARDEQRDIAARISELEEILNNAEIVPDEVNSKKISIGSKVLLHDKELDEDVEYTIVGSTEAKSLDGYISGESPVGAALLGHKKNDVVKVETPGGQITYKVLKIERL